MTLYRVKYLTYTSNEYIEVYETTAEAVRGCSNALEMGGIVKITIEQIDNVSKYIK